MKHILRKTHKTTYKTWKRKLIVTLDSQEVLTCNDKLSARFNLIADEEN